MEASSSSDLRSLKGLKMELKGVEDAFSLNAGVNIDKSLEFASSGDSVRYTSDDFIAGVQDSFEYARDQGIDRGEALLSALRENVDNFNDIYPDALDLNSVLSDISKNVNDDFGFDKALSRFQQGQANRSAMEAELTTAKATAAGERAEAQSLRLRESLGITKDTSPEEAQRIIMEYANNQQSGIAGAGIPDPTPPKPNLRLVKKAAGGKVDLRSGIGDIFKVYS